MPLLDGALKQAVELGHRFHELDAVLRVGQPLVDLDERHDVLLLPQVGHGVLAADRPIDRLLEQNRCQDFVAGEAGALHQPRASLVDQVEHLTLVAVRLLGNSVERQCFGGAATTLIKRGDKATPGRHLGELLFVHCHPSAVPLYPASRNVNFAATTSDEPANQLYQLAGTIVTVGRHGRGTDGAR